MSVILMTCAQWSETSKEPSKELPKETPQNESEKKIHIQVA
jgi:hypothetical protein